MSRTTFLGVAAGAAAPLLAGATAFAAEADVTKYPLPKAPIGLSAGNARAAAIAERSPVARAAYARVAELAHSLADAPLRDSVLALLVDPTPRYALRRPTASERTAVRDALAAAGLVAADAPVAGIFPARKRSRADVRRVSSRRCSPHTPRRRWATRPRSRFGAAAPRSWPASIRSSSVF